MKVIKRYVVVKGTKEKLEVVDISGNVTTIRNTKGQMFNVPSNYLEDFTKDTND